MFTFFEGITNIDKARTDKVRELLDKVGASQKTKAYTDLYTAYKAEKDEATKDATWMQKVENLFTAVEIYLVAYAYTDTTTKAANFLTHYDVTQKDRGDVSTTDTTAKTLLTDFIAKDLADQKESDFKEIVEDVTLLAWLGKSTAYDNLQANLKTVRDKASPTTDDDTVKGLIRNDLTTLIDGAKPVAPSFTRSDALQDLINRALFHAKAKSTEVIDAYTKYDAIKALKEGAAADQGNYGAPLLYTELNKQGDGTGDPDLTAFNNMYPYLNSSTEWKVYRSSITLKDAAASNDATAAIKTLQDKIIDKASTTLLSLNGVNALYYLGK